MQFETVEQRKAYEAFIKLFPQYKHCMPAGLKDHKALIIYKRTKNVQLRRWREQQATPKGCRSGVISRYKAIHKRGLSVDHIVPLQGVDKQGNHIVCGLNVAWNLQGISVEKNQKKGNLFVDSPDSLAIIPAVVNRQLRKKKLSIDKQK